MASRLMISPVVTIGSAQTTKAEGYCDRGCVNFYAFQVSGIVAVPWALTLGRATSWLAANADPQIEFLFSVPSNIDTPTELKAWLRATTFGDLSVPQRTALQTVFDAHAINRADFTVATTLVKIVRRIQATLFELDYFAGMGFFF